MNDKMFEKAVGIIEEFASMPGLECDVVKGDLVGANTSTLYLYLPEEGELELDWVSSNPTQH